MNCRLICCFILFLSNVSFVFTKECGPMGYNAQTLLSPSYWYFDLENNNCPPLPAKKLKEDTTVLKEDTTLLKENTTLPGNKTCRIYFNLCKQLSYQCSGTVCVRYLKEDDLVGLLGQYHNSPFSEPLSDNRFIADYLGESLTCATTTRVKTAFSFHCNKNATWSGSTPNVHGGREAPHPDVTFDNDACKLTFKFNYSGACWTPGRDDSKVKKISTGTFAMILFFPGVLLYFLMGVLFNCSRGKTGNDIIPHHRIIEDLPELILDGFMFTVAVLTCNQEQRNSHDYEEVLGS